MNCGIKNLETWNLECLFNCTVCIAVEERVRERKIEEKMFARCKPRARMRISGLGKLNEYWCKRSENETVAKRLFTAVIYVRRRVNLSPHSSVWATAKRKSLRSGVNDGTTWFLWPIPTNFLSCNDVKHISD